MAKHSLTSSFCEDAAIVDYVDSDDGRKEQQQSGSIKFSTYKTFFKACRSNMYLMISATLFVVGNSAYSACDYFLCEW